MNKDLSKYFKYLFKVNLSEHFKFKKDIHRFDLYSYSDCTV